MAYGLLQAAIEEAAGTAECSQVQVAAELEYMQKRAIRSMRESALATIDLFEAIGAMQTPGEFAIRQLELARQRRDAVNDRLGDFFEIRAQHCFNNDRPLNRQMRALSRAESAERGAAEADDKFCHALTHSPRGRKPC